MWGRTPVITRKWQPNCQFFVAIWRIHRPTNDELNRLARATPSVAKLYRSLLILVTLKSAFNRLSAVSWNIKKGNVCGGCTEMCSLIPKLRQLELKIWSRLMARTERRSRTKIELNCSNFWRINQWAKQ